MTPIAATYSQVQGVTIRTAWRAAHPVLAMPGVIVLRFNMLQLILKSLYLPQRFQGVILWTAQ